MTNSLPLPTLSGADLIIEVTSSATSLLGVGTGILGAESLIVLFKALAIGFLRATAPTPAPSNPKTPNAADGS